MGIQRVINGAVAASTNLFWGAVESLRGRGQPPSIKSVDAESLTQVDRYWSRHTVNSAPFKTAHQSRKYLEWRSKAYPLFAEFMQLYNDHDDQVVLDYGCGPGNDLVGFAIYTRAKRIVGVDISEKALNLARGRLALHRVEPDRVELIHSADSVSTIPLADGSVDYVHCAGVLQHTSNPESLLREFYRVLRPNSRACIMVYNRDSLWLHLYTAYQKIILENAFPGMDAFEAFSKNVDGVGCPLARCYGPQDFISMCNEKGFQTEYIGGYFSDAELDTFKKYEGQALNDERLADEHKNFIKELVRDERGFPKYKGKHAGVGGVYRLHKV